MEITQEELNERVAILRNFKKLLERQREKFNEYLDVLEKQKDSITSEDGDALLIHTEIESQVVKSIANLQKVIVPMQKLYSSCENNENPDKTVENLQNELDILQKRVLEQNKMNRDLLSIHMERLQTKIHNFKNPYKGTNNVYAQKKPVATMVEVTV